MKPASYLVTFSAHTGFVMPDREPETRSHKTSKHGFIRAEDFLRQQPLKSSILRLATSHCMASKRVLRSMSHFSTVYHMRHRGGQSFDMMVGMLKLHKHLSTQAG